MHRPHVERSGNRLRHRPVEPPDQRSDHLSNDQSKCVSAEHGDDRRRIKSPDDQTFEHETERAHDERGRYHSEPDRQAEAVGEVSDIGAKQNELALREVEDTHHAGDDAEPKDDQNHDRAETQYLENCDDQISHGYRRHLICCSCRVRASAASLWYRTANPPDRASLDGRPSATSSKDPNGSAIAVAIHHGLGHTFGSNRRPDSCCGQMRPDRNLFKNRAKICQTQHGDAIFARPWRTADCRHLVCYRSYRRGCSTSRKLLNDRSRIHRFRRHGISSRSILPTINVKISASAMVATRAANTFGIT